MKDLDWLCRSPDISPSRMRFVQGLAAGGVLAGLHAWPASTFAAPEKRDQLTPEGTEFDLVIAETPANFTGTKRAATTINGGVPGPILRWREGSAVTMRVTNRLKDPSSIHWHGILVPFEMDGVPGINFPGITPGETFTYKFKVQQTCTYWNHSHSRFQEQTGVYGTIVIDPIGNDPVRADRDYVLVLSDWTDNVIEDVGTSELTSLIDALATQPLTAFLAFRLYPPIRTEYNTAFIPLMLVSFSSARKTMSSSAHRISSLLLYAVLRQALKQSSSVKLQGHR